MSHRGDIAMTPAAIIAHAAHHNHPVPKELRGPALLASHRGGSEPKNKARAGSRKLRQHRQPNELEGEFGHKLERDRQAGEIDDYIFEGVTLRWGDMEYTADYFVIRAVAQNETDQDGGPFVQAVYVEIKGGHKWEDSIIKFKAFRARMKWATFEMWGKENGRWVRLA